LPESTPVLKVYQCRVKPLGQLEQALRDFFKADIERGHVKLTSFAQRRQILLETTERRHKSARTLFDQVDRIPSSEEEAAIERANTDKPAPQPVKPPAKE